jgi:flavin reductase (DIM6/NTAB) family NADH-FMN oxidoreductase RutF
VKKSLGPSTLIFPNPAWVICTYDPQGKANAMTAAWAGVACSQPPCLSVSLRAATYTHACLRARQAFTICLASEEQAPLVDYLGLASGRHSDKFSVAGLTPVRSELVDAPYVDQFPLVMECSLRHTLELGLHTLFVGEVLDVKADPGVLDEQGRPDPDKIKPLVYTQGRREYRALGRNLGPAFNLGLGLLKNGS